MLELEKSLYILPLIRQVLERTEAPGVQYFGLPDTSILQQLSCHLSSRLDVLMPPREDYENVAPEILNPILVPAVRSGDLMDLRTKCSLWLGPAAKKIDYAYWGATTPVSDQPYSLCVWDVRAGPATMNLQVFSFLWSGLGPLGLMLVNFADGEAEASSRRLTELLSSIDPSLEFYRQEGVFAVHKPDPGLARYRDRHSGDHVFIIGNGPSLSQTDLDLIEGQPSIAMNRISLIYKKTRWRPSYYLMVSDNVCHPEWGSGWTDSINEAVAEPATECLIGAPFVQKVSEVDKIVPIQSMTEFRIGDPGSFSRNAAQHLSKSGTTMNMAFQLALYMGFSKVILVGADMNWQTLSSNSKDVNHFDPTYGAAIPDGERERIRMRNTHAFAKSHFDEAGISVLNASLSTMIDVYPLIDFEAYARHGQLVTEETSPVLAERREIIDNNWRPYRASGLLKEYN